MDTWRPNLWGEPGPALPFTPSQNCPAWEWGERVRGEVQSERDV